MKVLITGANGQLGQALLMKKPKSIDIISSIRESFDLTSKKEVDIFVKKSKPDLILNAAAYTAVDKAEGEKDLAYKVNALAPKYLAELASELGIKLIQISTDFVFDGKQNFPYKPNQKDLYQSMGIRNHGEEFIEKIMGIQMMEKLLEPVG